LVGEKFPLKRWPEARWRDLREALLPTQTVSWQQGADDLDRYIAWPGQALAYKMGEIAIRGIRTKAEKRLGARFDLRGFHDALLGEGALPIDVLEDRMDRWIDEADQASPSP